MTKPFEIQYFNPKDLSPHEKNSRVHSQDQIDQLVASISTFGFLTPILISKEKKIIAGHARQIAATQAGLKKIPCIPVDHLTEKELRAFLIADNKIAENSGWDIELLRAELDVLKNELNLQSLKPLGFLEDDLILLENNPADAQKGLAPTERLGDPAGVQKIILVFPEENFKEIYKMSKNIMTTYDLDDFSELFEFLVRQNENSDR